MNLQRHRRIYQTLARASSGDTLRGGNAVVPVLSPRWPTREFPVKSLLFPSVYCLFGAVLPVHAGGDPAAKADWKVGLAQAKITPERPMPMSGYGGRTKPFEKVAQDLYVKALVLEDREGHRAVLVTSDLLGFPAAVAEPICQRIEKKIGLKREHILLNSSHTHAGPQLSLKATAKD